MPTFFSISFPGIWTLCRLCAPLLLLCLLVSTARAVEVIPPVPARYFNDYSNKISTTAADQFNDTLEQFERDTSNQIVVAVYPRMQSDSDIADYTFRVKENWKVGQKKKNNGAVLFVFMAERAAYIQVNYGLEGALPDAVCKRILDEQIFPHFKSNDFEGGLRAGIAAILAATRGEFRGTGKIADQDFANIDLCLISAIVIFIIFGIFLFIMHNFGGAFYERHRRSLSFAESVYLNILNVIFFFLSLIGSGSSSGSSRSGGFSGGGGTGGGGGAGGKW